MGNITITDILQVCGVVFMAGAFWAQLKAIRRDINRLEEKVEKHNTFDRRIIRLETLLEMRGIDVCQNSQNQVQKD